MVSRVAEVTNGDKTLLLDENEYINIPVSLVHAQKKPGKKPLELINVESCSYFGEAVIVYFEDLFGRV